MSLRKYEVGRSTIAFIFGDITTSKAEAVVSSDDYFLSMGGGVSRAIRRVGGAHIATDASKMVPARVGDVIVSTAGDLPAKYVLHAITIGPGQFDLSADAIVRQTTERVMQLLPLLGCASVAFPAIGAGVAGIPYEVVASEMAGALVSALLDAVVPYDVELYLMDRFGRMNRDDFFVFFEKFAARRFGLSTTSAQSNNVLAPPATTTPIADPTQAAEAERRHQVYMMLRHLDSCRNQIEADMLQILGGKESASDRSLSKLRGQLEDVKALRHSYEAELLVSAKGQQFVAPDSVFVSSTSTDLKPHRQALRDVIKNLQLKFIGMEEFLPTGQAPADLIRQKVIESRVYLGVLGMRYGYVDPATGFSMTELEYRQAIASDKTICMFVMDQNASIQAGMVEDDPSRFAKLFEFRNHVMKTHTCGLFTDAAELALKAEATLKELPLA